MIPLQDSQEKLLKIIISEEETQKNCSTHVEGLEKRPKNTYPTIKPSNIRDTKQLQIKRNVERLKNKKTSKTPKTNKELR